MDYNKLKTFLTVAQQGSITEAARKVNRTQSAITQQIKFLEDELGFSLFDRKHARIYLTREGEKLAAIGNRLLGELDDAVIEMKNAHLTIEGTLRVGVLEDYGAARFWDTVVAFKSHCPKVHIEVSYATSAVIERRLLHNQIDMGILLSFKDKSFFRLTPLCTDDHLLVTTASYLEKCGPITTVEQLLQADLLDLTEDFLCIGTWMKKNRKDLLSNLLHRKPSVAIDTHSGIKSILSTGFGIAILPRYLIGKELQTGSIVQLMPSYKPIQASLDVAVRKKHTERLFEKRFKEILLATHSKQKHPK